MDPRQHHHQQHHMQAPRQHHHARFPSDAQVRLQRQEIEQQRRVEQLEHARQMNQISPDDYNKQLHLMSFSYLANIMAMRERKRQDVPAYHQRSMY